MTRNRLFSWQFLSAILFMSVPSPATAQDNTEIKYDTAGTLEIRDVSMHRNANRAYELVDQNFSYHPDSDTPEAMAAYAAAVAVSRCISGTYSSEVVRALATEPSTKHEEEMLDLAFGAGKSCGSPGTSILILQRGMLSEAAYLTANPDQLPMARNVDSAAVASFASSETDWNDKRGSADKRLVEATNCLVATNPAIADLLARTDHGSADEEVVMDALFNAAPQCAGARPEVVGKTFLRAFIMDSLYRVSISAVAKPIFSLGG